MLHLLLLRCRTHSSQLIYSIPLEEQLVHVTIALGEPNGNCCATRFISLFPNICLLSCGRLRVTN
jgi:hypothetical protein